MAVTINCMFIDSNTVNITFCKSGLFANTMTCSVCLRSCLMAYVKRKSAPYEYNWACKRPCLHTCSIRTGSFFDSFKIGVKVIFKAIYKYPVRISYIDIACKLNICRQATSGIDNLIGKSICEYMAFQTSRTGGMDEHGVPKVVKIDEILFF